jgi:membrane protein implicated in regulation of membrane protease activity
VDGKVVAEGRMEGTADFRWTLAILFVVFFAPLTMGFLLEINWLIGLGFFVALVFILALYGAEWQRRQRRREVWENMRRILEERKEKNVDPK